MSGHSKWSKIKRQKGKEDQKRGAEFSRLARSITIAAVQGKSGDVTGNPTLRLAVEKARAANMPKANIQRAIERGLGAGGGSEFETVTYEGYGPGGVAVMVTVSTDNRQRTTANIKNIFERGGGTLGGPGSALFLFERQGAVMRAKSQIIFPGEETERIRHFLEMLGEQEDVDEVVHNAQLE